MNIVLNFSTGKLTRRVSQGHRSHSQVGTSPLSNFQGQNAVASSLLQKLISEAESRGIVFSEDLTAPPPQQSLHGLSQSSLDDVIHQKWLSMSHEAKEFSAKFFNFYAIVFRS